MVFVCDIIYRILLLNKYFFNLGIFFLEYFRIVVMFRLGLKVYFFNVILYIYYDLLYVDVLI